jgi:hypothetical protein
MFLPCLSDRKQVFLASGFSYSFSTNDRVLRRIGVVKQLTVDDFLQLLDTCNDNDKDFVRRVFAREKDLVDLSAKPKSTIS